MQTGVKVTCVCGYYINNNKYNKICSNIIDIIRFFVYNNLVIFVTDGIDAEYRKEAKITWYYCRPSGHTYSAVGEYAFFRLFRRFLQ